MTIAERMPSTSSCVGLPLYKDAAIVSGDHTIARKLVLSVINELPKYKINEEELQKVILKKLHKV